MDRTQSGSLLGVKYNVDACFDEISGMAGVGIVIRDIAGCFLKDRSVSLGCASSALMAETMGVREALSWVKGRYKDIPVVIEMDCLPVKSALESNVLHMNSYFAILIHDWKSLVRKFTSLSFSC